MLTVLIADDEINICNLIKNEIEWEALDLQFLGSSTNSLEVLEMMKELKPDIVITDIQMPCLSGLKLIKEAQTEGLNTNFIIISGYSYFEYAKEAISLGVDSFLLKPINHKELNESLSKIIDNKLHAIQKEQRNFHNTVKVRKSLFTNPPIPPFPSDSLNFVNKEYQFSFSDGSFIIGKMAIDSLDVHAANALNINMVVKAIERNCSHLCLDYEICEHEKNRISFIMNFVSENLNALNRSFQYLINELSSLNFLSSNTGYTIAISQCFSDLSHISKALSQVSLALSGRIVTGFNRIEVFSPYKENLNYLTTVKIEPYRKSIAYYIEIKDYASLISIFDRAVAEAPSLLKDFPYDFYFYLSNLVSTILVPLNISFDQTAFFEELDHLEDISLYTDFLHNYVQEILDHDANIKLPDSRKAISIVKDFVNKNYSSHITLETLADIVFLAPAYLSNLFKQETGINFVDYVTNVRIDVAKDLLKNSQKTIKEIALHIGYRDEKYFSKIFKKNVGIKPTEYRKVHNNF